MSHDFTRKVKPPKASILGVPTLLNKLGIKEEQIGTDSAPEFFDCGHGCNLTRVFGKPFWIDFTSNQIKDPSLHSVCPNASSKDDSSGGTTTATAGQRAIRHPRVNITEAMENFPRKVLTVEPVAAAHDDDLVSKIPAQKVLILKSPEKVPLAGFFQALRNLASRLAGIQAVYAAAIGAATLANRTAVAKRLISTKAPNGNMDKAVAIRNLTTLAVAQKGVLEVIEYAQLTHQHLFRPVKYDKFMEEIHTSFRHDINEITDLLSSSSDIVDDMSARLDSNAFSAIGVAVMQQDEAKTKAMWRKEKVRYEAAAKKLGWKPATAPAVAAGASAPAQDADAIIGIAEADDAAAAAPSPDRSAGGDGSGTITGKKRGPPQKFRPKGKQRKEKKKQG